MFGTRFSLLDNPAAGYPPTHRVGSSPFQSSYYVIIQIAHIIQRPSLHPGRPTVPENLEGTLTSSGLHAVHSPIFSKYLFRSYIVVIVQYLGRSYLENYACVIALGPDF